VLEEGGRVEMTPSAEHRRRAKGELTLADDVLVTFPLLKP
jgi:hypothetical protein